MPSYTGAIRFLSLAMLIVVIGLISLAYLSEQARQSDARPLGLRPTLACSRIATDHPHECDPDRCFLAVGKRQLRPLLDPRDSLIVVHGGPGRLPNGKRLELLGDFARLGKARQETRNDGPPEIVGDDSTVIELKVQCRLDELGRYFEQLFGEGNDLFARKTAVPFLHRLG
jgi:hypothetical protein